MAFEWNWKGSQNAYDAYKTAEDIAAQRYWANRDYIDAQNQAIADQYAALGARGPVIYNNMSQQTSGMVNPYGPLFNPSAASVDEIKAMQSQIGTKADGAWGPKSQRAYNKYMQNMIGVTADGVWGPKSQAAYDAAYTNPAYAASQQAYANAPAAYEAQMQQQQAQQAQAQQDALRAELAENEQKIAWIQMEITRLEGSYNRYMDELDMRLAANRANAGDIGNAIAHQNRIITRKQLDNASSGSNKSKEIEDIEDKIINAYRELAFAENDEQKQVAQYDIDRFKKQYKTKTGKEFKGNPFSIELGTPTDADTFAKAKAKLDASKDKNGRYTEAAWKTFEEDIKNVPWSQVDHGYVNDMKKVGTQEAAAKAGAKKLAKQKAALAEAKQNIRRTDLDKSGSYDYTATNGETVNVKRSKFGTAVFSIGKLTETVDY